MATILTDRSLDFDNLSALIHPRLACLSLVEALRKKGCEVVTNGKNQGKVIWATGVHDLDRISHQLEKILEMESKVKRHYLN